jgi:hypothetical protein
LALLLVVVDFASALNRLCNVVTVDAVALLVEMVLLTASDWACGVDTVISAGALALYDCRLLYVSMLYARVVGMQVSSLSSSVCLGGVRRTDQQINTGKAKPSIRPESFDHIRISRPSSQV